ncbi:MAG: acetyl-CoA carboxylase biotin carboxylase subunit [Bdellovibrionota bacterium]
MFQKILIANRGEIALRIIRACREMGIATVAVHSNVDSESLHVKMADESVCIGPAKAQESYLSVPSILSAAEITGADAIHPGYGFLAENADFAEVCRKCDLVFIGPSSNNIRKMGDKIKARNTMRELGLKLLPSVQATTKSKGISQKAMEEIGFPLIIKASAGGGGKGIKIVHSESEFREKVRTVQAEAKAAFGDPTIYIEKYLNNARHIEFQVAADLMGNVICFGERDCSIQRRHQKIFEETHSPALTPEIRSRMQETVIEATQKLGYENVGTLEFLMGDDGEFYFLEMNTRIQVEHPITEEVYDIDLIKMQIQLAMGEKLSISQGDLSPRGHAFEWRINAEDSKTFFPSSGTIDSLHFPGGRGVRVDSGIYQGAQISPHYDSMIGKLVIRAATRMEAIEKSRMALAEFQLEGVSTNIALHKRILDDPNFIQGEYSTHFLPNMLESKQ